MKTVTKVGISAISAAAVAGFGYLGKKMYDKSKTKTNVDGVIKSNDVSNEVSNNETSETQEN